MQGLGLNLGSRDWPSAEPSHTKANVTLKGSGQTDKMGTGIPGGEAKAAVRPSWAKFGEQKGLTLCN